MPNTWILYKNLWRSARLTPSSENPQFPANYSRDDSGLLWYQSAAAALTPNIVVDLGSAQPYNFIGIKGHNLTSGSTIQVQGADDAGISSNVVTDNIVFNGNNIFQPLAATRTKRHIQLSLSDASNPSNYIKVTNFIVGMIYDLGRQFAPGSAKTYADESEIQRPPAGMRMLVQAAARPRIWKGYRWDGLSDATAAILIARDLECGRSKSFLLCFDISDPNTNSFWVETPNYEAPFRNGPGNHDWAPGDILETL